MVSKYNLSSEIVSLESGMERVMERFDIGFSPQETLNQVAQKTGIDPDFLVEILKVYASKEKFQKDNLYGFSLECILDYLKKTHRYYIQKLLPHMEQSIAQLIRNFSDEHHDLILLPEIFLKYKNELEQHIHQEESILFPYIEDLLLVKKYRLKFSKNVNKGYSIAQFINEHDDNTSLPQIRKMISRNSGNADFPMPYRIFIIQLSMFEHDLKLHAKVEDEILIPKALELENSVMNNLNKK